MQTREFLHRVWGGEHGWAFLAHLDTAKNFQHKAYRYPGQMEDMVKDIERWNGWANVYFGTHLYKSPSARVKEQAMAPSCLWIDYDRPNPENIYPKPTICWESSDNRYQAVWLLEHPLDPERAEQVNRYLTYKNKGDKGKWALSTVLRIPGSVNYKYEPHPKGKILWSDGPVYDIDSITPSEQELKEVKTEPVQSELPKDLPSRDEVLTKYGDRLSSVAWKKLQATPAPNEDWSESLWQLARLLIEAKLPSVAIYVLLRDCPWNKYKRDGRPSEHLWQDVVRAHKGEAQLPEITDAIPWIGLNTLMSYNRKPEWLVEGIWMESNVGWIAGQGKSYKSVLSLDLALSVASGNAFLGKYAVNKPGPVLMIQEEDTTWRLANRLRAMRHSKDIDPLGFKSYGTGFTLTAGKEQDLPIHFAIGQGINLVDREWFEKIEASIAAHKPRMIVLDPWFHMTPGLDEFKASEIAKTLIEIKQWRNKYDCAIVIVHHYNKGAGGDSRNKLYGSQALYSWSENSLFVARSREDNTVVIERDIKDALTTEKINVCFNDIDTAYSFETWEGKAPQGGGAYEAIIAFLSNFTMGQSIPREEIVKAVDYSDKQVSRVLVKLSQEGLVTSQAKGRGGKLFITVQPKLKEVVRQEQKGEYWYDEL